MQSLTRRSLRQFQSGVSKLTLIVFLTIVGAAGYAAYCIAPFYYYYYELQSHMEQMVKLADELKDEEIRKRLMYHILKYELPIEKEDLKIERNERGLTISLKYKEVFYVTWRGKDYDLHVFEFHAFAETQH